jgi:hypothetical protein
MSSWDQVADNLIHLHQCIPNVCTEVWHLLGRLQISVCTWLIIDTRRNTGFHSHIAWIGYLAPLLMSLWPWADCITCICLKFLHLQSRDSFTASTQIFWESKWNNAYEVLITVGNFKQQLSLQLLLLKKVNVNFGIYLFT